MSKVETLLFGLFFMFLAIATVGFTRWFNLGIAIIWLVTWGILETIEILKR